MRILFFGTPEFAEIALNRLIESEHEIIGVVAQPDRKAGRGRKLKSPETKVAAEKAGIPVYQPEKVKDPEFLKFAQNELQCDIAVVVAYGQILPKAILDLPKHGCLNIHGSLLPAYRGAAPIQWAIANGEKETGVTIMQLDEGMDTGPIVAQAGTEILDDDDAFSLYNMLAVMGADLMLRTIGDIEASGKVVSEQQDESKASNAPLIKKQDARIDWNDHADDIICKVRGFVVWPGATTSLDGEDIKITQADGIHPEQISSPWEDKRVPVGMIVDEIADQGVAVKAQNSLVLVKRLKIPGKKEMDALSAVRGGLLKIGTEFD